jgi:hypothetical protein
VSGDETRPEDDLVHEHTWPKETGDPDRASLLSESGPGATLRTDMCKECGWVRQIERMDDGSFVVRHLSPEPPTHPRVLPYPTEGMGQAPATSQLHQAWEMARLWQRRAVAADWKNNQGDDATTLEWVLDQGPTHSPVWHATKAEHLMEQVEQQMDLLNDEEFGHHNEQLLSLNVARAQVHATLGLRR